MTSRNEPALLYIGFTVVIAFAFNRWVKSRFPARTHMLLVDLFIGCMVTTLLGIAFPELISWYHPSADEPEWEDYHRY